MTEFKPLNLAELYKGADQAVASAMQMNLMALQATRMKQEFDEEDSLRALAKSHTVTNPETGAVGMDLKSFTKAAYGVNPMKAMGFEKASAEASKTALEQENLQGQVDERRQKIAAEKLKFMNEASSVPFLKYKELIEGGMADAEARKQVQPMYVQGIRTLVGSGIFSKEQLDKFDLRPEFDPAVAEVGHRQVLGAQHSLEAYFKEKGFKEPKSDVGKLKADLDAGKITKEVYDAAVAKHIDQPEKWTYDSERGLLVNRDTGQTRAPVAPGGGQLPPKNSDVEGLRKEFNARQEVKNFNEAVPVLRAVAAAPNTPAGDLDFIYGVGKILDPGSVVREGEMNLVIKSGTPVQRILGTAAWTAGEGKLTPGQRQQLMEALQGRVKELHTAAIDARKPFEEQAKRQGIKVEETLTLPDLPKVGGKGTGKPAAKAPASGTVEDGYRFRGGDPSKAENWEKV